MNILLKKHKKYFSDIKSLFDYQEEVLNLLYEKQNVLSIIPTGGGKSLIFQLMSLELEGLTLVISPLLALMEEQVNELKNRGIDALALNSNISFIKQRDILRNLNTESYKIIYISPERLQNPFFRTTIISSRKEISMIVIDEAHCISQWGNSFRPDYGQINSFVNFLNLHNNNPFLYCLTATLSKQARKDIIREFRINNDKIFVSKNMIRENLNLNFQKVNNEKEKEDCLRIFLEKFKPIKTVVYLYSRKKCEVYSENLSDKYKTKYFHSGLELEEKQIVYDKFLNNEIEILFATTAFGMGINIPDIECVIHLQIPNSIEEYYQQVGRGWRKKNEVKICHCLALWSDVNFDRRSKDIEKQKYSLPFLKKAFNVLIGGSRIRNVGQVVNKDYDALHNSDYNLRLLKYKLEKYNIIKNIGEINGTPLTITLFNNTDLWNKIVKTANEGMDGFNYVSKILGISIIEIINHLYQQDLLENIKKLPAMKKDVFFELLVLDIEDNICNKIIKEINDEIDFRISNLDKLKDLFLSKNYLEKINEVINSNQ